MPKTLPPAFSLKHQKFAFGKNNPFVKQKANNRK
jgi:hypothetical protein